MTCPFVVSYYIIAGEWRAAHVKAEDGLSESRRGGPYGGVRPLWGRCSFSAGAIDWTLNRGIATKPWELLAVGAVFAFIYYVVFLAVIKKFNLPTPGREEDVEEESVVLTGLNQSDLSVRAQEIMEALGGKSNIVNLDACITRLRVTVKDSAQVDEAQLKKLGATGVMKINNTNFQVVVGTVADPLATQINRAMKM